MLQYIPLSSARNSLLQVRQLGPGFRQRRPRERRPQVTATSMAGTTGGCLADGELVVRYQVEAAQKIEFYSAREGDD